MNQIFMKVVFLCFTLIICANEISTQSETCENGEWACHTTECIALKKLCNGMKDCSDGSDEAAELCSKNACSKYSFRCNYGACVDIGAKCDGVQDCIDNSDENSETCPNNPQILTRNGNGGNVKHQTSNMQGISDTLTIPITQPLIIFFNTNGTAMEINPISTFTNKSKSKRSCKLDDLPNLITRYKHRPGELEPGQNVAHSTSITYKCRAQHILEGAKGNLCIDGKWYNEHPKCVKYCSAILITGATIQAKCEVEGSEIACNETLPGTIARISCNTGYQKPEGEFPEVLTCSENGQWDFRPAACEQICGRVENGNNTNYLAPWHASIYTRDRYKQVCSGAIINARVVLSASHCYWDFKNNEPMDKSQFIVALSKQRFYFYVSSGAYVEESPQFFNLVEIYISPNFRENAWYYNNDLAVLVLDNYINFKPFVKPVCIDWELNSKEPLAPNITGKISGWDNEDLLKNFETGYITIASYEECALVVDPMYSNSYTGDKFCAMKNNETCILHDGGGFVMEDQSVFYLRGIISHSINFGDVCSKTPYVAITNIQLFSNIITEYDARFRPRL